MHRILTFDIGAEGYGIEISCVREIIPYTDAVPISGAPPYLKGVLNLRGEMIPLFDILAFFEPTQRTELEVNSCIVVAQCGRGMLAKSNATNTDGFANHESIAFVISRVGPSQQVSEEQVNLNLDLNQFAGRHPVLGAVCVENGTRVLLSPEGLLASSRQTLGTSFKQSTTRIDRAQSSYEDVDAKHEPVKMLLVEIAGVRLATMLEDCQKIMEPGELHDDPIAPDCVSAVGRLKDEFLPYIRLHDQINEGYSADPSNTDIALVVDFDGLGVAFSIDHLGSLISVSKDAIQTNDSVQTVAAGRNQSTGFVEYEGVTYEIISLRRCISDENLRAIRNWKRTAQTLSEFARAGKRASRSDGEKVADELVEIAGQYVVVGVGNLHLGIAVRWVQEVLSTTGLQKAPGTISECGGVLSVRGESIPVMHLGQRLGYGEGQDHDRKLVVLHHAPQGVVGILIDEIVNLTSFEPAQLRPAREATADVHRNLILGAGKLDDELVTLIDLPAIIASKEPSLLGQWEDLKRELVDAEGEASLNQLARTIERMKPTATSVTPKD